jgi:hypothetical protein
MFVTLLLQSQSYVTTVSRPVYLGVWHSSGAIDQILLLTGGSGVVDVERPL